MSDENGNNNKAADNIHIELSGPKMDTSSQIKKTINGITEPIKKDRAKKINSANKE